MTTLVNGSAGVIGSNFVLGWQAQRDEPILNLDNSHIDRPLPGPEGFIHTDFLGTFRPLEATRLSKTCKVGDCKKKLSTKVMHAICALLDELSQRANGKRYAQQITHVADQPRNARHCAIDASATECTLSGKTTRCYLAAHERRILWFRALLSVKWPDVHSILSSNGAKSKAFTEAEVFV
jgi:dTDP-D-glucose 4,6-dehydratase